MTIEAQPHLQEQVRTTRERLLAARAAEENAAAALVRAQAASRRAEQEYEDAMRAERESRGRTFVRRQSFLLNPPR